MVRRIPLGLFLCFASSVSVIVGLDRFVLLCTRILVLSLRLVSRPDPYVTRFIAVPSFLPIRGTIWSSIDSVRVAVLFIFRRAFHFLSAYRNLPLL